MAIVTVIHSELFLSALVDAEVHRSTVLFLKQIKEIIKKFFMTPGSKLEASVSRGSRKKIILV